ncbi:hypothetical protein BO82DRAFT_403574 [Aspergillus uvarum CBS 121591]|uniref:Glucose-methanol-choline oxidoreductase C-terminal domain-containing protein n=1 Tax=Aspergillus uvarum CBS 121591 TaxID=1448315 RepID=A0A319C8Q0_9EURO|nr:hypothetical protein BO82DRAFT_403574 [Aspergillus uvarum CBS 121591]PYH80117.1 hypothetical protein BO82DRAFT_403574 [Aspergillus uvarum CBS 121591]
MDPAKERNKHPPYIAASSRFRKSLLRPHHRRRRLGPAQPSIVPSSRGTITLASTDSAAAPLIDPNYYATEVDRVTLRAGNGQVNRLMLDTPQGKEMVTAEVDEAFRKGGMTFYHPAGSAA